MCGLVGFLGYGRFQASEITDIVNSMGFSIRHRGPDDAGSWQDNNTQIAMAHQRLSILDLTPTGHQPMISQSGRFVGGLYLFLMERFIIILR